MLLYNLLLFSFCYSSELFEEYYKEAETYMQKLTMEERIGQMFFPRFNLANSSDDIKNRKPGGFMLFAYDFNYDEEFIKNYIKNIQKLSIESVGIPLGLSVDEEGGIVNRVSKYHRTEEFPSPQEIYSKEGIEGILKIDQEKRDLLRKFNLNVNLAPVADVSYNKSDYIYRRTLGKPPIETANYIEKDVEGYVNDKFSCCLKHFPGYGNNVNTHGGMAIDERSYDVFLEEDFLPFIAAIKQNVPMILISHNIVVCKDPNFPASISKIWHDILRNELNYSGLIVTDSMSMGAIRQFAKNESEAVLAVLAGNDIILTSTYYRHYDSVIEAYKEGIIDDNIINTACRRIIAWKLKYGIIEKSPPVSNEMIKKLEKSGEYSSKIETLSLIGNMLFEQGFEASFIAGILANIYHEGKIGSFESSNYISNPDEKPEYLKYMDDLYNYREKYSNKLITEISMKELNIILEKLKRANWKKGQFGLGCAQWKGERTYKLFKLYQEECNSQDRITIEQAGRAEGKMLIKELTGEYKEIYEQWKKENTNPNTPLASYKAGYIIYTKYENPIDTEKLAKIRARTANDIYHIMKS